MDKFQQSGNQGQRLATIEDWPRQSGIANSRTTDDGKRDYNPAQVPGNDHEPRYEAANLHWTSENAVAPRAFAQNQMYQQDVAGWNNDGGPPSDSTIASKLMALSEQTRLS